MSQAVDPASRAAKPSSNILEIVHRFAKVCKLKSIGAIAGENPNNIPSVGDGSDATEETESGNDNQKIHPQPFDEMSIKARRDISAAMETFQKLFAAISSLKLAYIQLQEAHTPYDPEKIQFADEVIVSKLKYLSEIKHSYREKQNTKPMSDSSSFTSSSSSSSGCSSLLSSSQVSVEIQEQQCLLEKLQAQVRSKDSKIIQLRRELEELDQQNAKLEEEINQNEEESIQFRRDLSFSQFSETFRATSKSIHDFAKPLIGLMKASGWDLDLAASQIEDSIIYAKRSDKKYAFDAYICHKMFGCGGWPESCNFNGVTMLQDPFYALIEDPDSEFAKFCRLKYLLVVHSVMEQSFFGNLDQRDFVMSGRHPRTPLYQAFVKMAKWVWILMGMAKLMEPAAEIFRVQKGTNYSEVYMESVVVGVEGAGMEVGLMVMPGFRIGEKVIRCIVYLSLVNSPHSTR
ncbi:hypothetical protein AAC387_Pa01g0791 [Persea americana]